MAPSGNSPVNSPVDALSSWAKGLGEAPKTQRSARTREAIVRAARGVFEERGFLEARIADFVEAAGVSHGSFYNHFQDKKEVFGAVISDVVARQLEATVVPRDLPADPVIRIEYTIRAYLRAYREFARISAVIEQVATMDEGFRQVRLAIRHEFRDRIERGIRRQQEDGLVAADLNPRVTAEALTSMVSNFAYVCLALGEPYDEDEAVRALTRLWASGLGLLYDGRAR